jgi:hypothetical protein
MNGDTTEPLAIRPRGRTTGAPFIFFMTSLRW